MQHMLQILGNWNQQYVLRNQLENAHTFDTYVHMILVSFVFYTERSKNLPLQRKIKQLKRINLITHNTFPFPT